MTLLGPAQDPARLRGVSGEQPSFLLYCPRHEIGPAADLDRPGHGGALDEVKWELVGVFNGRLEAELLQSYLEARGIEVAIFQEAVGHHIYPVTIDGLGRVQLFVSKANSAEARELISHYQRRDQPG